MNKAGLALVKDFEGFRARAYLDAVGVPTIGYGFTKGVQMGDLITQEQADQRLLDELNDFEGEVAYLLKEPATDNQSAAMTSLAYNVGVGAFRGSTVLREHNAGNFRAAADAFRLWNKAGGRILSGLVARREAERALYLS